MIEIVFQSVEYILLHPITDIIIVGVIVLLWKGYKRFTGVSS